MNTFCEHHQHSIKFGYRCFDRILLNGLIQPFQQPERVIGFFNAYRQGERVTRKRLGDIAQQFQNWVKNRCQKWGAPILDAPEGRRDDFVDPYFKHANIDEVVVILKAREPARIMTAIGAETVGICSWRNAGSSSTTSIGIKKAVSGQRRQGPLHFLSGELPLGAQKPPARRVAQSISIRDSAVRAVPDTPYPANCSRLPGEGRHYAAAAPASVPPSDADLPDVQRPDRRTDSADFRPRKQKESRGPPTPVTRIGR
jgi:hypothetical protein